MDLGGSSLIEITWAVIIVNLDVSNLTDEKTMDLV
jgi:hypothetical protein